MKSFDEFCKKHELTRNLDYVELAWNTKQAEVDELRKNFNNALKTIEIQQRFLDDADGANKILTSQASELQKRIDEVIYDLQHIESAMWEEQVEHVLMILKGDQS